MFVIGFMSYLIQNAATGIISAANRELPPKAKLRMAEIDAARAAGVAPPSRYRIRDYVGDWVSDALQKARDDRRERLEERRREREETAGPADGDGPGEAPELATTTARPGGRYNLDDDPGDLDDDPGDGPGVVHDDHTYCRDCSRCRPSGRPGRLWSWACRSKGCPGKGFDYPSEAAAAAAAADHMRAKHPGDPDAAAQVSSDEQPATAPGTPVGDAPSLAGTPGTATPPRPGTPAANTPRAATHPDPAQPGGQPHRAGAGAPADNGRPDMAPAPTRRDRLRLSAELFGKCGVPKRAGDGTCGDETALDSIFCTYHQQMFAEHPQRLAERLGERPTPQPAATPAAGPGTTGPGTTEELGVSADGDRPPLRLVRPGDTSSGATPPPPPGPDTRPDPTPIEPGPSPDQGGTTVSTTASAETTNIDAAKAFLTELGEHITDDVLAKIETAKATLAAKNIDSDTLGLLSRIQEQGQALAALCESSVEHIGDYHGQMADAVNNTEEVADLDFYQKQ